MAVLSQEDVSKLLQNYNRIHETNFEVVKFSLKAVGEIFGLCGDHAVLKLTVQTGQTLNFFVKFFPAIQSAADFAEGTGSFRKEKFMYELFDKIQEQDIKILESIVPHRYFNKGYKVLVLEDLLGQGYKCLNKREYLQYDSVKVVLETIAKLHASSIIFEEKLSGSKPYRLIDEYRVDFDESYFNDRENFPNSGGVDAAITGILRLVDIFKLGKKTEAGKDLKSVLKETCYRVYALVKPSPKVRNVINHGDLWATNFMIQDTKCKLVDFQCGRYAPPTQDVMAFLHLTTSRNFRDKFMYKLVALYYNALEKHLLLAGLKIDAILPFKDFLDSCEEQKLFARIQAAVYFPIILLDSEVILSYFADSDWTQKALLKDRSLLVLANMDKDQMYHKRIYEAMLDLKDSCDYL